MLPPRYPSQILEQAKSRRRNGLAGTIGVRQTLLLFCSLWTVRAKRVKALLLHFSFSLDASRNHDGEVFAEGGKVAGVEGENRRSLAALGTRADNGVVGATAGYAFFRSEPAIIAAGRTTLYPGLFSVSRTGNCIIRR